jgi:hypothetical protein
LGCSLWQLVLQRLSRMPYNNDKHNKQHHYDRSVQDRCVFVFRWRLARGLQSVVLRFVPAVPLRSTTCCIKHNHFYNLYHNNSTVL